tara:strand:- start:834 stop:1028 length:195 start_codon:yes stop_codon:yes gene_type:complete
MINNLKSYTSLFLLFVVLILLFVSFQIYTDKKYITERLDIISSQIEDLDDDIHRLEDLIGFNKD